MSPPSVYLRPVGPHEPFWVVVILVVFGLMAIGGRWALVQAQAEGPRVLAGLRLALGALAALMVCAGLNGIVYFSGASCSQGPPSIRLPALCALITASTLLALASTLIFLVSLIVWPPWRRPLWWQFVRALVGVGWLFASAVGFGLTGVIFYT